MKSKIVALLAGMLFAFGLGLSGMTLPAKVIGFLNISGHWDPSLAFVMIGAIGVHALAWNFWLKKKKTPILAGEFHLPPQGGVDRRLLVGAGLFGVGWGIGGFCPGPALLSVVSLDSSVLIFVVAMLSGMALFQGFAK